MSLALAAILFSLGFLLFYAVWGFFITYHLFRFAPHREVAVVGTAAFIGVTALLLLVTVAYLNQVDWSVPFALPSLDL